MTYRRRISLAAVGLATLLAVSANPVVAQTGNSERRDRALPTRLRDVLGERQLTVVVLASGTDTPNGPSDEVIQRVVSSADAIWSKESNGRIRIRLEAIRRWSTEEKVTCDHDDLMRLARSAGNAIGWTPRQSGHLVLLHPDKNCRTPNGLGLGGLGSLGGRHVWMNWLSNVTRETYIDDAGSLLAHEIGHNFGLNHTKGASCSTALRRPCSTSAEKGKGGYGHEYGGDDRMGSGFRRLNPVSLYRLGLLPRARFTLVDAGNRGSRTVSLAATRGEFGVDALRILSRDGRTSWWLSYDVLPYCTDHYHSCVWPDEDESETISRAVRVHTFVGPRANPIVIQQDTADGESELRVGQTYGFPGGQLTVVELTDTHAVLSINTGRPPRSGSID